MDIEIDYTPLRLMKYENDIFAQNLFIFYDDYSHIVLRHHCTIGGVG